MVQVPLVGKSTRVLIAQILGTNHRLHCSCFFSTNIEARIINKDILNSVFPGLFQIVLTFINRRPKARNNVENN